MRVVYEWTQSEWDEAIRLAAAKKRRGSGVSPLALGAVVVPLIGGGITGLLSLRQHHASVVSQWVVLAILGLLVLLIALWIAGRMWRMRVLRSRAQPMPMGECEAVLQEGGWRFCAIASQTETVAVVETIVAAEATENETPTAATPPTLTPWNSMTSTREGRRVMVFLHTEGFAGMPMRCLSEDQVGHLQRMMARKLRPVPVRR